MAYIVAYTVSMFIFFTIIATITFCILIRNDLITGKWKASEHPIMAWFIRFFNR